VDEKHIHREWPKRVKKGGALPHQPWGFGSNVIQIRGEGEGTTKSRLGRVSKKKRVAIEAYHAVGKTATGNLSPC